MAADSPQRVDRGLDSSHGSAMNLSSNVLKKLLETLRQVSEFSTAHGGHLVRVSAFFGPCSTFKKCRQTCEAHGRNSLRAWQASACSCNRFLICVTVSSEALSFTNSSFNIVRGKAFPGFCAQRPALHTSHAKGIAGIDAWSCFGL
jgi:hypothetical protein